MIVRHTEAGTSWTELAALGERDPLAAVLDPADRPGGGKNRLIDRVHKAALRRAEGRVRGRTALDFGCGTGRLSEWLVRRGAAVDGVDVTPEMVAVARARVPEARFQAIDGSTVPFEDGRFDLIVTAYVLQYYVEADGPVPRELLRVLRPGGGLLAIEQVADADLGHGGSLNAYRRMFADAGFEPGSASTVRVGDSRVIAAVARRPALLRLPLLPWLVRLEARRLEHVPLVGGRYADVLFRATKPVRAPAASTIARAGQAR